MSPIIRNVADLSADERNLYEQALGQPLSAHQQVVIQVVEAIIGVPNGILVRPDANGSDKLPDWCTIWADLSDKDIDDLESSVLDRSDSRPC